jgi:hypothetical protein
MADARPLNDLFSMFGPRRPAATAPAAETGAVSAELTYPTKALQKFLAALQARENPVLIDLGPVVGSNVTFFGEHLGCRIRVEDLASDIDRHVKDGKLADLPRFFSTRFKEGPESVDGILCWDVLDYLDRPAAQTLAASLAAMLRPDGALLGFFNSGEVGEAVYTKYIVVDRTTLRHRTYPARRARQRSLLNGDIIRLFKGLRVTDSFLMKSNIREMLFKKGQR